MNEIQRQINMLLGAASGGAIALAKGLSKPEKPKAPEVKSEVGSSMGYTTELSSDEAAAKAFSAHNEMVLQKVRSKYLRDAKTGKFIRAYNKPEGGKE